jgi:hypothetical protein
MCDCDELPDDLQPGDGWSRRDLFVTGAIAASALAAPRGDGDPVRPKRGKAVQVSPPIDIAPRSAWATGRPPKWDIPPEEVKFLLVHHTASTNAYSAADVPGILRQTYDWQTSPAKGWPDVCYHFFVDRFGRVWEGRAGSLAGPVVADATGGNQGYAQLVCLVGDFTSQMPSAPALEALATTLAWLAGRYSVDTSPGASVQFVSRGSQRWPRGTIVTTATVAPHRSMSYTACPGNTFAPYVERRLQADVHAALAPRS